MGVLLLVRHGQASFGADDYDVLSETGWEQGRLLGGWLAERGVVPDAVVRGSMRRHRETLDAMTETAGWTAEPLVDQRWDEFDHLAVVRAQGETFDGMDRRAFQQQFERATARWAAGEGEYAETYAAFVERSHAALGAAAALAGSGRTVVVVSSGGPIGVACARLVDPEAGSAGTARLWARFNAVTVNSSVTRVVIGSTGSRLLTFNEHQHLVGDAITYR